MTPVSRRVLLDRYPLAFVLLPFTSFLAGNLTELSMPQVFRVIGYCLLLFAFSLGASRVLGRFVPRLDARDFLLAIAVFVLVWFSYARLPTQAFVLAAIFAPPVAVLACRSRPVNIAVAALASVTLALSLGELGIAVVRERVGASEVAATARHEPLYPDAPAPAALPNVYYIMLDAYSRKDQFERLGYTSDDFYAQLERYGFYVAPQARANYPMTQLSLSAVWEMDYPATGREDDIPRAGLSQILAGRNRVVDEFRRLGYEFVRMGPGPGKQSDCSGSEDLCLTELSGHHGGSPPVTRLDYLEQNLLRMTPLFDFLAILYPRDVYAKNTLANVLDGLATCRRELRPATSR